MKITFLPSLVTLVWLISPVYAGELLNKTTNESIIFTYNESTQAVEIKSRRSDIPEVLRVNQLSQDQPTAGYFSTIHRMCDLTDGNDDRTLVCVVPPVVVASAAVLTYDLFSLPVKAVIHANRRKAAQKDYEALLRSINTDETIEADNDRFERIIKLLIKSKGN